MTLITICLRCWVPRKNRLYLAHIQSLLWFWVHTGCPNKFAREASIVYKKVCILLQKIAFSAFFCKLQNENCFWKQLCSNLLNKLLHKIMEKSCFKKQFSICSWPKMAKKAIFWSRIHFFTNVRRFVCNHFWASKPVWTSGSFKLWHFLRLCSSTHHQ